MIDQCGERVRLLDPVLPSGIRQSLQPTGRLLAQYLLPGAQQTGGPGVRREQLDAVSLGINQDVWASLDDADRHLIETACTAEYALSLAEFDAGNAAALTTLRQDGNVTIRAFDPGLLARFAEIGADVVADAGSGDAIAGRILASHARFLASARPWSDVGIGAYLGSRAVPGR